MRTIESLKWVGDSGFLSPGAKAGSHLLITSMLMAAPLNEQQRFDDAWVSFDLPGPGCGTDQVSS
jgi:hypothetical protein